MRPLLLCLFLLAPRVALADCPLLDEADLERLTRLELGLAAARLEVRCEGARVELRVTGASRSIELAQTPKSARARLVALAAAELAHTASREPFPAPPTTTRKTRSEKAMWKRLLAVTLVAQPALAVAPPKPEARVEAHATTQSRAPARAAEAAPALRAEQVFQRAGAEVHAVTDAQIGLLGRLIAESAGAERADLLLRSGDLYSEQERYFRFRARSLDQPIFAAERARKDAAPLRAQQAGEEQREQLARRDALKQYLAVVNGSFPDYPKMDQALFEVARLLRDVKKEEAARTFFRRLIKDHPTSRYIPDALLAFADDAFERRDLETAIALYEKVMQHPESPLAEYARYKTGWCHYNLLEFKAALDAFVTVADHARRGARGAGALTLEREARKDTVRAYAQVGAPERAWPFFQRVGGEAAPTMLADLAELYHSQGKFLDAVRLYRQLIALFPQSLRVCAWQLEVTRNTLARAGSRAEPDTVRELERLAALESRARDAECRDNTSALLRELATVWHQEAQRTNQLATYELAGAVYRLYLKSFGKAPDAPLLSYYYADILYKLGRHCDAAPLFADATRTDPKHREDAALGAVLSYRECLHLDEPRAHRAGGAPRPLPESWRKMVDAFELYLKYVKTGPDRVRVAYQEALAWYEFDHCDKAMPIFGDLARHHQDSELAPFAADLLFDCHAQRGEKQELRAATAELCASPALTGPRPDFAQRCRTIQIALARSDAEGFEGERKWHRAGDEYIRIANEHPDDPQIDEVLHNGGVAYQRGNLVGLSILAFQRLLELRPDSPLAAPAAYSIGRSYQNIAAFDAAADSYERYAEKWPNERDAASALQRASFLRHGLGEGEKSLVDTRRFLSRYGARPELADTAAAVAFGQGQIFEQQHDDARLAAHLRGYLATWGERGGIDRQVIALVKLGELAWRASCPVAGVSGVCVERRASGRGKAPDSCGGPVKVTLHTRRPKLVREADLSLKRALVLYGNGAAQRRVAERDEARAAEMAFYAAEARMLQADAELERFLALALPTSRTKLRAWFTSKTQTLEHARRSYESVILLKQAHWAIAAAGRVGQMFQTFGAQLNSLPVPAAPPPPRGISASEWRAQFRSAYCDDLAAQVVVLEDKAEDALKLCLDKSTQLSWFNEWSSMCESELNAIKPRTYPLAAELRAEPNYATARAERAPPRRD